MASSFLSFSFIISQLYHFTSSSFHGSIINLLHHFTASSFHGFIITFSSFHGFIITFSTFHGFIITFSTFHGFIITFSSFHGFIITFSTFHGFIITFSSFHGLTITFLLFFSNISRLALFLIGQLLMNIQFALIWCDSTVKQVVRPTITFRLLESWIPPVSFLHTWTTKLPQRDFWPPFFSSFKPAWATDQ